MTEKKLPGNMTLAKLQQKSPQERNRIFESTSNSKLFSDDDKIIYLEIILDSGPLDGRTALTRDNPFLMRMDEIINSPSGRAACIQATEQGLPALAGVEPMLVAEFGDEYENTYMSPMSSGGFVGMMMRDLNYIVDGRTKMPDGSVAKTATVWKKRR